MIPAELYITTFRTFKHGKPLVYKIDREQIIKALAIRRRLRDLGQPERSSDLAQYKRLWKRWDSYKIETKLKLLELEKDGHHI